MNIKTKIKSTILLDPEIKKKLLLIKWNLSEELENYLKDFFSVYEKVEKEILTDIEKMIPIIYLKTIQDIEKVERKKDKEKILEIEKQLLNI